MEARPKVKSSELDDAFNDILGTGKKAPTQQQPNKTTPTSKPKSELDDAFNDILKKNDGGQSSSTGSAPSVTTESVSTSQIPEQNQSIKKTPLDSENVTGRRESTDAGYDYYPDAGTLAEHSIKDIQDYLKKNEPGTTLILPKEDVKKQTEKPTPFNSITLSSEQLQKQSNAVYNKIPEQPKPKVNPTEFLIKDIANHSPNIFSDIAKNTEQAFPMQDKMSAFDKEEISKRVRQNVFGSPTEMASYTKQRVNKLRSEIKNIETDKLKYIDIDPEQGIGNVTNQAKYDEANAKVAERQDYINQLKNSVAEIAADKVLSNTNLQSFNPKNVGRKIVEISDPELDAQFKLAERGGNLPGVRQTQLERLGLNATKQYLDKYPNTPNIQAAKNFIQDQESDFEERNIDATAATVRNKIGEYLYHKGDFNEGKSGVFGYSQETLRSAINDPALKLTPGERKIAETVVLPTEKKIWGTDIPGSGFARSFRGAIEKSAEGTVKSVLDFTGLRDESAIAGDILNQPAHTRYTPVSGETKFDGWKSGLGDLTGQVAMMALTTKGVGAIGKVLSASGEAGGLLGGLNRSFVGQALQNENVRLGLNSFSNSYDNYKQQAINLMPGAGQESAREGYATSMAVIEGLSEKIFNDTKVLKAFAGEIAPTVRDITKRFVSNEITSKIAREEMQGAFVKYAKPFAKEFAKSEIQEPTEESVVDVADGAAQAIFGGTPFDIAKTGQQALNTFVTTALYSPLVSALAAHGHVRENNSQPAFMKAAIGQMAANPGEYLSHVDELVEQGAITPAQANEKRQLIKSAANTLQEIPESRTVEGLDEINEPYEYEKKFTPAETNSYLLHRLNEQIIEKKLETTTDPVLESALKAEQKRSIDIRRGIYKGTITVNENLQEVAPTEKKAEDLNIINPETATKEELKGTPEEISQPVELSLEPNDKVSNTEVKGTPEEISQPIELTINPTEKIDPVKEQIPITDNTTASIPVMITKKMEVGLRDLGHTQSEIDKMTPIQANDILKNNQPKEKGNNKTEKAQEQESESDKIDTIETEKQKTAIDKEERDALLKSADISQIPESMKKAVGEMPEDQKYKIAKGLANGETVREVSNKLGLKDDGFKVRAIKSYYGIPSIGEDGFQQFKEDANKISSDAQLKREALNNIDYTKGEVASEPKEDVIFNDENEVKNYRVENSQNPAELAAVIATEENPESEISKKATQKLQQLTGQQVTPQIIENAVNQAFEKLPESQKELLNETGTTTDTNNKESEESATKPDTTESKNTPSAREMGETDSTTDKGKSISESGKELANRLRKLKSKPNTANANIFGLAVGVYDGVIETIATAIENGAKLADAIKSGLDSLSKEDREKVDENAFNQHIKDFSEGKKPKIKVTNSGEDILTEPSDDGKSGITHVATEETRKEFGINDPYEKSVITDSELNAEAEKQIKEGYNIEKLITSLQNHHQPSALETTILKKYKAGLEAQIEKNPTRENLEELKRFVNATDTIGSEQGRAFRSRQGLDIRDDSLAGFFTQQMDVNGDSPITPEQQAKNEKEYAEITAANDALKEKIAKLEKQLKEKKATENVKKNTPSKKKNKTHDDFVKERKDILADIKEKLRKARGETNITIVPYAKELIAIAPDVAKLTRSLVEEGVTKLGELVDKIHENLVGAIPEITKQDVLDLVAGEYNDKKQTRSEISEKLYDLRTEAKLINRLQDLNDGIEPKNEKAKVKRTAEIEKLKDQIKEHDLTKLAAIKSSTPRQIKELEEQIKTGNFEKSDTQKVVLDKEATDLKDRLIKLKLQRAERLIKEKYANRTIKEQAKDLILETLNVPRTLMSSIDYSAPLRQAVIPTVAHPTLAAKAGLEMFKQSFSQKRFDRWFYDLKDSPRYKLMQMSGLYVADPHDVRLGVKEESFMNNLAERIPLLGRLVKGSERAYVGYLNKMRVDLFNRIADGLEAQGKTFENNQETYKAMASFVNNATGRGNLGPVEVAAPVLNSIFFAPRYTASILNILGLSDLVSGFGAWGSGYYGKMPWEIKKMALGDAAKFVGVGLSILALMQLAYGKKKGDKDDEEYSTVEADPRSSDFGKIRIGNTRWNLWGSYQPTIRYLAQGIMGEAKSNKSGKIIELNGEGPFGRGRGDLALSYLRSKMAPIPSAIWDLTTGRNAVGEKVTAMDELQSHLMPLFFQDVGQAVEDKGIKSLFTVGLPSMFGVGVQTYGPKNFKNVDTKDPTYKFLYNKNVNLPEAPQEGKMTDKEYKEFIPAQNKIFKESWDEVVKNGALISGEGTPTINTDKGVQIKDANKLSDDDLSSLMKSISSHATKQAKKDLGIDESIKE